MFFINIKLVNQNPFFSSIIDTKSLIKKSNSELLDSIITFSVNGTSTYKCIYVYDVNRRVSYFSIDLWLSNHWEKDWLRTFTYDSIGNVVSVLHEYWDGSKWKNSDRETFIYDSNRNKLFGLLERCDNNFWVNNFRYTDSYDSNGNILQELNEHWSDSSWIKTSRMVYNPGDSQTSYLYQLWDNNTWIDNRQGLFEYDSEGRLIFNTVKIWDGSKWDNSLKVTFNYDSKGNREVNLIEMWNGNQWVNSDKISYMYNSDNYFTYALYEVWKNSEWIHEAGGISIENPPGYQIGFITCEMFAYYSSPTDVKEEEFLTNNYELFNNYPNPFNPTTKIKFTVPASNNPLLGGAVGGLVTLKVYDILGNEIATLVNEEKSPGTYEVVFSAKGFALSSGVYFYTIRAGDFTQTKKMILAK